MRLLVALGGVLAAAVLCGCGVLPRVVDSMRNTAFPASASLAPPPNPSVPYRIDILHSPRTLLAESAYPPMVTRQRIVWDGDGLDWRIRFPSQRYAYGHFSLRRPIDLQPHYRQMRLMFKIRPARSAAFLAVALIDRPESGAPVLSDVPLVNRAPPLGDGWTTVSIPLADFPVGLPAAPLDGRTLDASAQAPSTPRPLDWSRIQEFRIISPGGRIPADEISIRELRFQRL